MEDLVGHINSLILIDPEIEYKALKASDLSIEAELTELHKKEQRIIENQWLDDFDIFEVHVTALDYRNNERLLVSPDVDLIRLDFIAVLKEDDRYLRYRDEFDVSVLSRVTENQWLSRWFHLGPDGGPILSNKETGVGHTHICGERMYLLITPTFRRYIKLIAEQMKKSETHDTF
jgi:hypothetical protein